MTFEEWLKAVDKILERRVGLSSWEMPDADWWDMWENMLSPDEAIAASRLLTV